MQLCVTNAMMYSVLPLQCKLLLLDQLRFKRKKKFKSGLKPFFFIYVLLVSNVMF